MSRKDELLIPSGEITGLSFNATRLAENGISSPEEAGRIKEQVNQLITYGYAEEDFVPLKPRKRSKTRQAWDAYVAKHTKEKDDGR